MANATPLFFLTDNETARLSFDALQWIVEVKKGKATAGRDSGFRGVSFISTSRDFIIGCCISKRIRCDLRGRLMIAALPDDFPTFRAAVEASGVAAVLRAAREDVEAMIGSPAWRCAA